MESSAVDCFLPKAAPTLPFHLLAPQASTSRPAENQPSFDHYLQAARDGGPNRRAAADERAPQSREQAARPAESSKPAKSNEQVRPRKNAARDDQKPDDSGSAETPSADDDPAGKAAAVAVAVKAASTEVAELSVAGETDSQPFAAAAPVAEEDAPADGAAPNAAQPVTEGEEAAFTAELAEAETTELRERAAARPGTEQIETIDQTADDADSQPMDVMPDAGDDLAELDDNGTEVSVKREPAEPVNPAPPAPTVGERIASAATALRPGEQIRAIARPASGPAGAAQQPGASRTTPAADAPVFDQVVRGASLMVAQGRSEIRVQLRPPELGTVRLHLVSDRNNTIEARIVTERDDVRQLVERNLTELREALSGSGIDVGHFDVSTQHSGQAWDDSAGSSSRRHAWDATESEGELPLSEPSDSVRGVNRSRSADAIDYII